MHLISFPPREHDPLPLVRIPDPDRPSFVQPFSGRGHAVFMQLHDRVTEPGCIRSGGEFLEVSTNERIENVPFSLGSVVHGDSRKAGGHIAQTAGQVMV